MCTRPPSSIKIPGSKQRQDSLFLPFSVSQTFCQYLRFLYTCNRLCSHLLLAPVQFLSCMKLRTLSAGPVGTSLWVLGPSQPTSDGKLEPLQRNQREETDTCFREKPGLRNRQKTQSNPTLVRGKRTLHRGVLGVSPAQAVTRPLCQG